MVKKAPQSNPGPRRPDSHINQGDKLSVLVVAMICLASTMAISLPILSSAPPINAVFLKAIPLAVGVIMFLLPVGIWIGTHINQEAKYVEYEMEQNRLRNKANSLKILFRSQYRPEEDGTFWEITNANKFSWTQAKLLIEREHAGVRVCEKHRLGDVGPGQVINFESDLEEKECAKWRIMILTSESQLIDFPDKQKGDESHLHINEARPVEASG